MGIPTLTSSTPAYSRAMDACGLDFYCENIMEWEKKLEKLIIDAEVRKKAGLVGQQHANNYYSEKEYLKKSF